MDVLVYVEATIYQADEENEVLAKTGDVSADHTHQGVYYWPLAVLNHAGIHNNWILRKQKSWSWSTSSPLPGCCQKM